MSIFAARIAAFLVVIAALGTIACSTPAPVANARADFYWSAARETYAAGDYTKTADHLEHLIADRNPYTDRAIPWYLVVTSGMAGGYMELADQYTAGAHSNKEAAAAFRIKASAYRTLAGQWAMQFAQNADKFQQIPLGPLHLGFALPKGSAAEPDLLAQIASGEELQTADAETAEVLTLQRAVLMAVCQALGARDNVAKAGQILAQDRSEEPRATFAAAIAEMLDARAKLYARNRLDEPAKLAALQARAEMFRKEAARVGSARVVAAASVTPANP
jgi:hypothetical protein